MTREEFISILEEKGYSYRIEGERIIVDHDGFVNIPELETLPENVEFRNLLDVWLTGLETLPSGVEFRNGRTIWLNSITSLPDGIHFRNGVNIYLNGLHRLSIADLDYMFQNKGDVRFDEGWLEQMEFLESRWIST
jgi:hypothetical protein